MPKSDYLLGKETPFVEASYSGPKQRVTAIVLRTSFTTGRAGAANGIAQAWNHKYNRVAPSHYVVDEIQTIRCLPDNMYTPGTHRRAISVNVCYDPPEAPKERVVYRTAKLVARLCVLHRIKPRILNEAQEVDWPDHPWRRRGGIILHTVGNFPTHDFFASFRSNYKAF